MKNLAGLLKSFFYAGRGVLSAVAGERNMRIHLFAVAFVIICGIWQKLSVTHWAIELVLCGAVLALELVNTALEALCDEVTSEIRPRIRLCKDAAAGAVLVMAAAAAAVWVLVLVGTPGYLDNVTARFREGAGAWITAAVWFVLFVLFVFVVDRRTGHDR